MVTEKASAVVVFVALVPAGAKVHTEPVYAVFLANTESMVVRNNTAEACYVLWDVENLLFIEECERI